MTYHLVVVGDGPMKEAWERHARKLRLEGQVRFLGPVLWEEVPSYIAGLDLGYAGPVPLAAGSMYLSPLKLYEYAASGKPFVASAYPDATALVAAGAKGYLFAPGDLEDLKRALRQAFAERTFWPAYGVRTRVMIREKHGWEARVKQLLTHVGTLLGQCHGTALPAGR
jgi:glycosyltransferase involved in cell wall biosynthesis